MSDKNREAYLDNLIDTLPDTVANLDEALNGIQEQRDNLQNDWYGVSASMSMMTTAAELWMENKADELDVTYVVETSGSWGISNLTQWGITDPAAPPGGVNYNQYTDADVTSGAPSATETQQYNRQIDFPEAYNHINQDLGLNGTYGIKDKIQKLTVAENLTIINRNKYAGFLKAYSRNRNI